MVSPFLSSVGVEGGERLESVRGRREAGRREWEQKPPPPPLAETSPSDLRILSREIAENTSARHPGGLRIHAFLGTTESQKFIKFMKITKNH